MQRLNPPQPSHLPNDTGRCRAGHTGRGLTLVEILVVVSIVSLLMAILLPGMQKAREQAKRLQCRSNLHNLVLGWYCYLEAYNDAFLQGVRVSLNYGGRQGHGSPRWGSDESRPVPKPLNPHVDPNLPPVYRAGDERDVFCCPSDRGSPGAGPTDYSYFGTSYHTNIFLIGQTQVFDGGRDHHYHELLKEINKRLPGIRGSQIRNTSKLILIGDHGWYDQWEGDDVVEWHHRPETHNIAFLDGHADFVRIRRELYVTPEYVVLPFQTLEPMAAALQLEAAGD